MTHTLSYLLHTLVVTSAFLINKNPTFLVPIASTASGSVSEDEAPATTILTLKGQDTDGDTLTFSIVTQNPTSPPFELETLSGRLIVPSGLDAEVSTSYEFVFGVRDGSTTTNSVLYRVNILDVNDNKPIFSSTSPARVPVFNTANFGTNVTRVTATDADVTPATITYSIVSGNNLALFALDANTGQITVSANLSTYNQDFSLTLQASDGTFTAVTPATVTITVTVNYCKNSPCQNGGNCTNMDNGYNCSCAEGFLGQNCSQVDYCNDGPCQNGGTCTNMDNGYNCSCTEGFLGQNCSRVDYCNDGPCQNGGTCTNMDNEYNCSCEEGFLGQNCSQVDFCYYGPCQNGATCTNKEDGYTCSCAAGYLGQNCSQVDYCSPSPCQHRSTCSLSDSNKYTCACVEGYQGRNCSQDYRLTSRYPYWITTSQRYRLEDAITVSCSENGWDVRVNMNILRYIYPNSLTSDIYMGDNTCTGVYRGYEVVFQQGLRQCLTNEAAIGPNSVYRNQLIYTEHDRLYPHIIRNFNWTVDIECDVNRNETASGEFHHDLSPSNGHHVSGSSHYAVNMSFYSDPNFINQIQGNPLHVQVGQSVYAKVYSTVSDWTIKMRVHTCYMKPSPTSGRQLNFYIIKDGCEIDTNTHIISQSTHETRLVFQDFQFTNNRDGFYMYCHAKFCDTSDYSRTCTQACNPNARRRSGVVNGDVGGGGLM